MPDDPLDDLRNELKKLTSVEVRTDPVSRLLYSTDASIYQIEPLGVAFPRTLDDLAAVVETAARYRIPILPRGSGSSLAGQAIGEALILDCTRYLNHISEINPEEQTATVEPGVILNALNREAARYNLQFGPDPASAERATLGGSLANNASGAHSIVYGMAADHLLWVEAALADGSLAEFGEVTVEEAQRKASQGIRDKGIGEQINGVPTPIECELYRVALDIREQHANLIQERWPRVWRRASGYSLNYLLPWSPSSPPEWSSWQVSTDSQPLSRSPLNYPPISPGWINLAPLFAGSEGTLFVMRRARLRMVPLLPHTILGVMAFPSLAAACDIVPELLKRHPNAVELIPRALIQLARSVPAFAHQLSWLAPLAQDGDPAALLVVEFSGSDQARLLEQARQLGENVLIAETPVSQKQVWAVRKNGLGILLSRAGDAKPLSFIEDLAVPVEALGDFVREMERILAEHGTTGEIYAHASAGCLHIRPILSLKTSQGVRDLRSIAQQAVALTLRLGGSVSGEHGDGIARSEWLEAMYGPEVTGLFRQLKQAADPHGLLNPGKIIDPPPMDRNLRYSEDYTARDWPATLDFSLQGGLAGAIEMCNGAGVCRKVEGVMCPSFQATREEMHSTRGRANLLRAMLTGRFPTAQMAEKSVYEALDLCLACKGCKAECPSAVDMAKLRYEFMHHYYQKHSRRLRDYLFGYISQFAWLGHGFAPLINPILGNPTVQRLSEKFFGLAHQRRFPRLARVSLEAQIKSSRPQSDRSLSPIFLLSDAFTEYFHPEVGMAAVRVLARAGYRAQLLPVIGAGRTLISKSFLEAARSHARYLLDALYRLDPQGVIPVVGLEPSEIYTLRDEYADLLPGDPRVQKLAERAYMIDEFLIRPGADGRLRIENLATKSKEPQRLLRPVLLHGHCYQKAQPPAADGFPTGVAATVKMLESVGYPVEVIDSSCCGMAGAFGYEAEHYELSVKVGEMALLPAVRAAAPGTIVAAAGVSCQAQIEDGTGVHPFHPVQLL
jgi:FAD/FMN-containing dehydrogenase/Fe-S oxidoreductase